MRETVCGLPVALSVMERFPLAVPLACGPKVTEIVQLAPAARLAEQVLVWKNPTLVRIDAIVRLAVPVFVSVTDCGGLTVPFVWVAKVRLRGDRVTAGAAA